jgi:hypothetical protein
LLWRTLVDEESKTGSGVMPAANISSGCTPCLGYSFVRKPTNNLNKDNSIY